MGKTAPTKYPVIPSSRVLPLEPVVESLDGPFYQAIDMDGVDDGVDFGVVNITNQQSVVMLVYCGAQSTTRYLAKVWSSGGNQRSWLIVTGAADARKLRLMHSDDGTLNAGHYKDWTTTNQVLPASGWAMIHRTWDNGVVRLFVDGVEITAWAKTRDDPITTLFASTDTLTLSRSSGGWTGPMCYFSIWGTNVLSPADAATMFNGGGTPVDPNLLVPSGGAVCVTSAVWNIALPLIPGAGDVPDNTGVNTGTTTGTMTASDVVDTPWIFAGQVRGLIDIPRGLNHLVKIHLPQIVNQPMQFVPWAGGGRAFLSTADQSTPGAAQLRLVYRFPGMQNQDSTVNMRYRYLVAADVGTTGVVTTRTSFGGPVAHSHVGTGAWVWITDVVPYLAGSTEVVQIETHRSAGAGSFNIKHVSLFIEPGSDPVPWGLDVEGWQADAPLSVHTRRAAAEKLAWLAANRRAQVCAWSADMQNLGRSIIITNGTLLPFARSPVKYGPVCNDLHYWVSGYQTGGYSCKLWTNSGGYAAAASLVLPAAGGWTPTGSWVNGKLPLVEDNRQRMDELFLELFAAVGATTTLAGLCVHEEIG